MQGPVLATDLPKAREEAMLQMPEFHMRTSSGVQPKTLLGCYDATSVKGPPPHVLADTIPSPGCTPTILWSKTMPADTKDALQGY
jgi:hypothetical protein